MEYLLIPVVALAASVLTFFTGFGLGTLLLPVYVAFYPATVAVAATAVVHLLNNTVKFAVTARHVERAVLLRFGIPAVVAGFIGAALLAMLGEAAPLAEYSLGGQFRTVTMPKLVIGLLMILFSILELEPRAAGWQVDRRWLPLGGILSGFFGGLSGHQGAFRSVFLSRAGLSGAQFIATGVALAVAIDLVRLAVYAGDLDWGGLAVAGSSQGKVLLAASVAALAGTLIGSKFLHKTTITGIRLFVGVLLIVLGLALGAGLI